MLHSQFIDLQIRATSRGNTRVKIYDKLATASNALAKLPPSVFLDDVKLLLRHRARHLVLGLLRGNEFEAHDNVQILGDSWPFIAPLFEPSHDRHIGICKQPELFKQ